MVSKKKRNGGNGGIAGPNQSNREGRSTATEYEQIREQRMIENQQRMEKLGILDLSRNLKKHRPPPTTTAKPLPPKPSAPLAPSRRSSRLQSMGPVCYKERPIKVAAEKMMKIVKIHIKEGSKPEVYTEEDEKLLGDSKATWTLYVDGYDEEGNRNYDPFGGKSCHQCRQKTLGQRTECSKCKLVQGQFCGDCLYMRYGENIIEVKENPDWVCPTCRGICNCSRCRRQKGWEPTGNIYRKVVNLGFKSVAHYLIYTRGPNANQYAGAGEISVSTEKSLVQTDTEADLAGDHVMSKSVGEKDNLGEDNKPHVSAKEIRQNNRDIDPDYDCDSVDDDVEDDNDDDNDDFE